MTPTATTPPPRPPRRSRADVVSAAVELLDRVGLPDLSMRRLGEELGVQASALYWHVSSKQELLAAVSERILAPLRSRADSLPADPSTAVTIAGNLLRDRLLAHRDGAEVVSSSLALGLVDSPVEAALTRVAERTAAPSGWARTVGDAVTHFVVGFTFHEQQRRAADAWGAASDDVSVSPQRLSDDGGFAAALAIIAAGAASSTRAWPTGERVGGDRGPERS